MTSRLNVVLFVWFRLLN